MAERTWIVRCTWDVQEDASLNWDDDIAVVAKTQEEALHKAQRYAYAHPLVPLTVAKPIGFYIREAS